MYRVVNGDQMNIYCECMNKKALIGKFRKWWKSASLWRSSQQRDWLQMIQEKAIFHRSSYLTIHLISRAKDNQLTVQMWSAKSDMIQSLIIRCGWRQILFPKYEWLYWNKHLKIIWIIYNKDWLIMWRW